MILCTTRETLVILLGVVLCVRACPKCPALQWCDSSDELKALTKVTYAETASGEKIYSGCNIPDPHARPVTCGLAGNTTGGWLCDPNNMLQPEQVLELQVLLESVNNKESYCRCNAGCIDSYIPNPIMVAIIKQLRVPDLSEKKCKTYSCYDVYPQADPASARAPVGSEINKGLESFQYNLPERWKHHKCDDYVYIVYTEIDQQFHVYGGEGLPADDSFYQSAASDVGDRFQLPDDLPAALSDLVQTISARVKPRDNTMHIIGMVIVGVVAVIIVFGIIITIVYCRKERAAGRTYSQIMRREAMHVV